MEAWKETHSQELEAHRTWDRKRDEYLRAQWLLKSKRRQGDEPPGDGYEWFEFGCHLGGRDQPAEQRVGVDPLAQLPLAPDRVQGRERQPLEQPFRRHARPADPAVRRAERLGYPVGNPVPPPFDVSPRVVGSGPVPDAERGEQKGSVVCVAAHDRPPVVRPWVAPKSGPIQPERFGSLLDG